MPVNPRIPSSTKPAARRSLAPRPRAPEHDNRAELTRQAILDAALEVFTEQTYGGARIENIAERAGVAMGTIYKYFPGKQALANEVFRHWKLRTREYAFPHKSTMSAREKFHAWFDQFVRFATDHPLATQFLQTHHHAAYLDAESLAVGDPMDKLAIKMVRDGQQEGAIKAGDAELLVAMVLGLCLGLTRELAARNKKLDAKTRVLAEQAGWDALRTG